jgi:hypothetical protein
MNADTLYAELRDIVAEDNPCRDVELRAIPANTYQRLTFGVIDHEARYKFTNGWCGSLAAAICAETGWRCMILCPTFGEEGAKPWVTTHVVAVDPDDIAVDIEGAMPLDDMVAVWEDRVGCDLVAYPTTVDEMLQHFKWACPQTIARHWVAPVLEQYRAYLTLEED